MSKLSKNGHWAKFCPERRTKRGVNDLQSGDKLTNVVTGGSKLAVYVKVRVNGRAVSCLLDSGCEQSIVNSRLVSNLPLEPTQQRLFAANKTELPVKGRIRLRVTVHGLSTALDALVTDAVEDVILGIDWLTSNSVQWNFESGIISLQGKSISLKSRQAQNLVRRMYVSETTVIPPGHSADVRVTVALRDHACCEFAVGC